MASDWTNVAIKKPILKAIREYINDRQEDEYSISARGFIEAAIKAKLRSDWEKAKFDKHFKERRDL